MNHFLLVGVFVAVSWTVHASAMLKVGDKVYDPSSTLRKVEFVSNEGGSTVVTLAPVTNTAMAYKNTWYDYQLRENNQNADFISQATPEELENFRIGQSVLAPNETSGKITGFYHANPEVVFLDNGAGWERKNLRHFKTNDKKEIVIVSGESSKENSGRSKNPKVKTESVQDTHEKHSFKVGDWVTVKNEPMVIVKIVPQDQNTVGIYVLPPAANQGVLATGFRPQNLVPYEGVKSKISKFVEQALAKEVAAAGETQDGVATKTKNTTLSKDLFPAIAGDEGVAEVEVANEEGKPEAAWDVIKGFSQDLVQKAIQSKVTYTRDPDLREVEDNILMALTQAEGGSVKLLAPAGVGKTRLIEGLMVRIANGDVPEKIKEYRFMGFSAAGLQAGTSNVGTIDARVNAMMAQARETKIVWIVDEAHALAGAGTHSQNSNDIFQSLLPEMANGVFKMIGISTPDGWSAAFSADPALNRRFEKIEIKEPSGERLIRILKSWINRYGFEMMSDEQLREVVRISDEFAIDGAQPSRATSMLNKIYAQKTMRPGPITQADLNEAAMRLWNIDPAEMSYEKRHERYQELMKSLQELSGQDEAKNALLETARRVMAGMQDRQKPRYRLMLGGPKGQGKTEIVKIFAKAMGLPEENRILMSNFTSSHQVEEMKNQIATYVQRNPFTVLFFDEIEKAHPAIQKALLGILDAGTMTYEIKQGQKTVQRTLRLKNASVFAATNAGQGYISSLKSPADFSEKAFFDAMIKDGLDEFMLDRMEKVVPFFYLTKSEFTGVLKIHIEKALKEISSNTKVQIEIKGKEAMIQALTEKYFRPQMSNRDVARIVGEYIRTTVTDALFHQKMPSTVLSIEWKNDKVMVTNATAAAPVKSPNAMRCEKIFIGGR